MALVAEPRRDHRAEASGGAAGGDHQQILGRFERGVFAVAAVAHHRAFADLGPFTAENPRPPVDEFGDIGFAFRLSFLNKCDELERASVAEFYQRAFGEELPESAAKVLVA